MTNQWHGGKGDKSRTNDREKFESNFDNIFRKTNENAEAIATMSTNLNDPVGITISEEIYAEIVYFLDNVALYDYPAQEAKDLLGRINND
jgi:hypothetical protein